jgi:hypothetical protein
VKSCSREGWVCWDTHISLCESCRVDMLRLCVIGGGFKFVPCERPRSSPCMPMMLH